MNCNKYKYKNGYIFMNGIEHAIVTAIETKITMEKDVTILTAEILGMRVNGKKIEVEYTLLDKFGNCE